MPLGRHGQCCLIRGVEPQEEVRVLRIGSDRGGRWDGCVGLFLVGHPSAAKHERIEAIGRLARRPGHAAQQQDSEVGIVEGPGVVPEDRAVDSPLAGAVGPEHRLWLQPAAVFGLLVRGGQQADPRGVADQRPIGLVQESELRRQALADGMFARADLQINPPMPKQRVAALPGQADQFRQRPGMWLFGNRCRMDGDESAPPVQERLQVAQFGFVPDPARSKEGDHQIRGTTAPAWASPGQSAPSPSGRRAAALLRRQGHTGSLAPRLLASHPAGPSTAPSKADSHAPLSRGPFG